MRYFVHIAIAIDQLANAVLAGHADETLSARAHRMRIKGQPYWGWTARAINLLFFWQQDHCRGAWQAERLRRQLPGVYVTGGVRDE